MTIAVDLGRKATKQTNDDFRLWKESAMDINKVKFPNMINDIIVELLLVHVEILDIYTKLEATVYCCGANAY